ncbi:putative kinesin-like protein 3 [[Candida] railenensis]|uniref:Kinesin-like protein 3 n=1 Tax=[Candida] railenensis TaxID=45579 RepID=A0A9P0VW82_9ASCO|nr:putative kinesin-like protein 3 [[Candida] railenensis]
MSLSTPTKRHSYSFGSTATTSNRNSVYITSPTASQHLAQASPPAKIQNTNIKVIARFRPPNEEELKHGNQITEFYNDNKSVSIHTKEFSNNFTFDKVFDPSSSQLDIYNYSIKETIDDFFKGYNGTILAYGQSGSGKSFTMTGGVHLDGIIPRLITDIFNSISNGSDEIEYTVGVSYMEIYMEQIRDLLDDSPNLSLHQDQHQHPVSPRHSISSFTQLSPKNGNPQKYTIHEDKANGVYVKGLKQAFVSSSTELLSILQKGDRMRVVGSTNVNVESSRSHTIFQIKLSQKLLEDNTIKNSNLFLVDLAGSEKIIKTGAVGHTLEEAKKINSSLSALGNVIYSLAEGKSSHIPYRDSKLTRILQESLGGNSRTCLIITCSPSSVNEQETLSTLRFGSSAKKIKNKAHINTELSSSAMKAKIEAMQKTIDQNKKYIEELEESLRGSVGVDSISEDGSTAPRTATHSTTSPTSTRRLSLTSRNTPTRIPRIIQQAASVTTLPVTTANDLEIKRRDKKIEELESTILQLKMENLKSTHEEDSRLFKLEKLVLNFSDKLNELEQTNNTLSEDILMSTKIIESRNERISKLENILRDQQVQMSKESLTMDSKLGYIKDRLKQQHQHQHHQQHSPSSAMSPRHGTVFNNRPLSSLFTNELSIDENEVETSGNYNNTNNEFSTRLGSPLVTQSTANSPKLGLNLRIVKPLRGGAPQHTYDLGKEN